MYVHPLYSFLVTPILTIAILITRTLAGRSHYRSRAPPFWDMVRAERTQALQGPNGSSPTRYDQAS
jgi:hypothetical protein